ncbi:hypothetical protein [Marinobacter sp. F3R08]|uniref:hypothetical protein n=1 Tax=Marinobacter sp. F3R08 TaxID=2841559 RepID=UPI001C0A09C1|nr:hypothetical protein [Marinobacter sp. F3R08]MBU2952969.1 hypothetical protein [Marinobacter sp. F3R08]
MNFLCLNHRRHFSQLPLADRKELWLVWMEKAATSSNQEKWREAISLAGSAFDLACLPLQDDESCMHIELTLSAILVSRLLSDRANREVAEQVIAKAVDALLVGRPMQSGDSCCGLHECVDVLLDCARHAEFYSDYLNWPGIPFKVAGEACGRVLH